MARFTPLLLILLSLVPLYYSLDCRKFSFAPACRGIMLKRSGGHPMIDQSQQNQVNAKDWEKEMLELLIRHIEDEALIANSDCVNVSVLRDRLVNARNELSQ